MKLPLEYTLTSDCRPPLSITTRFSLSAFHLKLRMSSKTPIHRQQPQWTLQCNYQSSQHRCQWTRVLELRLYTCTRTFSDLRRTSYSYETNSLVTRLRMCSVISAGEFASFMQVRQSTGLQGTKATVWYTLTGQWKVQVRTRVEILNLGFLPHRKNCFCA